MLKAIETEYKGYKFRSRLEARYAVLLDELRVKWEYEPEGFDLDGLWYLPDFWLYDLSCWLEIKPEAPHTEEITKAKRLSLHTKNRVFIIAGQPWLDTQISAYHLGIHQDTVPYPWHWFICADCGKAGLVDTLLFRFNKNLQDGFHNPGCTCEPVRVFTDLTEAFTVARQARFEFLKAA